MSKTHLPCDPDQQLLLPAALQEWLAKCRGYWYATTRRHRTILGCCNWLAQSSGIVGSGNCSFEIVSNSSPYWIGYAA